MSEQTTRPRGDLVDAIVADHQAIERAFRDFEPGGFSTEMRRELIDHIIAELMRNSVTEEQYLYPTVRERLPDGERIAEDGLHKLAEAEVLMKQLERVDAGSAELDELAGRLFEDTRRRIAYEERDLLPRLRKACSAARLQEFGAKITKAKQTAPHRPHPAAPDRPPVDAVLDPGQGMLDRLREALSPRR